MKQVATSKGTFLFVEVPDGICHTDVVYYGTVPAIEFRVISTQNIGHVELPRGVNYNFICTTKNATEEHAAMVVGTHTCGSDCVTVYDNYAAFDEYENWIGLPIATESLRTLQVVNLIPTKRNYAIIQKL